MANPIKKRLADLDENLFTPRELSWLSFNARVLQEARDTSVPIIQRLRYLGIFSSNLDEFFRVRVAEVRRLISVASSSDKAQPKVLLVDIQKRVADLQSEFDSAYRAVLKAMAAKRIYMVREDQLDSEQNTFVRNFFFESVLPLLEPILLQESMSIPVLSDETIYLAIDIKSGDSYHYAVVEVPTDRLDRFVEIPRKKGKAGKVFIVLDNIIRACLPQMFRGVIKIDSVTAYCFKFSRDADLAIDTGISQSLIDKMTTSLKQRRKADAVRFEYDAEMPARLLDYLASTFGFGKYDSLVAGGRYHNAKDFMTFPTLSPKYLEFKPLLPIRIERLDNSDSIFDCIKERDVFLCYPYHPFDYVVNLLKTAALDPKVTSIKICLYRIAHNSQVAHALLNAVQNGKKVVAVVELAARFDEAANIGWAQRLTEGGIDVISGIPGLKVHSKLLLIERREDSGKRYYSHIGTGNFNEKTARLYTDFTLITYDQNVGKDVYSVFDFLRYNYKRPDYRVLMVSPHTARSSLLALMDTEIENARAGYRASMTLKCNNLVDKQMALKLYEASEAGVEVKLIIRGMCSLLPGVKGLSENIQAISIVDRYLEHPRTYVFFNRGNPLYLIGSADLMTRNLDFRVEVLCPVYDQSAQKIIQDTLDQQWHDNIKARILDQNQTNRMVKNEKRVARVRSQESIHRYLSDGKLPRYPKSRMNVLAKRRRKLN
jgi:polyphosphate kinase